MTGNISDDGMWRWDGQRWVPNQGPPSQPPPEPPPPVGRKRSRTGRNLGIGCGGALAALVALIVILVAVNSGGGSKTNTSSTPKPGQSATQQPAQSCKQPCAEAGGVTMSVTNVNTNATPSQYSTVQPGMSLVTVSLTVTNQSNGNNPMVNPFDFKLQDSAGTQHNFAAAQAEGCPMMNSVNVAKGGTSGPQCLVFQVPQDKTTGMTLIWQNSTTLFGAMQVKLN